MFAQPFQYAKKGFTGGSVVKEPAASAGDVGLIPGLWLWPTCCGAAEPTRCSYSSTREATAMRGLHPAMKSGPCSPQRRSNAAKIKSDENRDFAGTIMVTASPSSAEGTGQWVKIPHASWPKKNKTKHKTQYCNKFNKDFLKRSTSSKNVTN